MLRTVIAAALALLGTDLALAQKVPEVLPVWEREFGNWQEFTPVTRAPSDDCRLLADGLQEISAEVAAARDPEAGRPLGRKDMAAKQLITNLFADDGIADEGRRYHHVDRVIWSRKPELGAYQLWFASAKREFVCGFKRRVLVSAERMEAALKGQAFQSRPRTGTLLDTLSPQDRQSLQLMEQLKRDAERGDLGRLRDLFEGRAPKLDNDIVRNGPNPKLLEDLAEAAPKCCLFERGQCIFRVRPPRTCSVIIRP